MESHAQCCEPRSLPQRRDSHRVRSLQHRRCASGQHRHRDRSGHKSRRGQARGRLGVGLVRGKKGLGFRVQAKRLFANGRYSSLTKPGPNPIQAARQTRLCIDQRRVRTALLLLQFSLPAWPLQWPQLLPPHLSSAELLGLLTSISRSSEERAIDATNKAKANNGKRGKSRGSQAVAQRCLTIAGKYGTSGWFGTARREPR